jgi:flap endonuclease-1
MGIRYLNRHLRENCNESIRCINTADLTGKRIAIDISIYLYKYEAEDCLLENIYLMLSIFRKYNIIPIFIFDGKAPKEKRALLQKRREDREEAQREFNKLKNQLSTVESEEDKKDLLNQMDILKTQIVQINKDKIEKVKNLIRAYGATYYDAPGEADELCALLVLKKKVWACLSEDMDLFVYGCPRVLRYFSLMNHTMVLYFMKGILDELQMTQQEFKDICILSGTDYNINANGETDEKTVNLLQTLKHFAKYKSIIINTNKSFYDWLQENTEYITDIELLMKIQPMFDVEDNRTSLEVFKSVLIANGPIRHDEIKCIMREEGFLYV